MNYNEFLKILNENSINNVIELQKYFNSEEILLSELQKAVGLVLIENQKDQALDIVSNNLFNEKFQQEFNQLINSDISEETLFDLVPINQDSYIAFKSSTITSLKEIGNKISDNFSNLSNDEKIDILFKIVNKEHIEAKIGEDYHISILDNKASQVINELYIDIKKFDSSIESLLKIDPKEYSIELTSTKKIWTLKKKGSSKLTMLSQSFDDFIESLSKNINLGTARTVAIGLALGATLGMSGDANAYIDDVETSLGQLSSVVEKNMKQRFGKCKTGFEVHSKDKKSINFTLHVGNYSIDGDLFGFKSRTFGTQKRNIKLKEIKGQDCDMDIAQANVIYGAVNQIIDRYK